ncbi:hypothetical protein FE783_17180 [Paenibacillus mesophilus]|uniref:hypothetical protein n=1 Tax=Paenibacillus mesophilus TaxID=2582849 RepID=UPI00110DFEE1|nr:hypothetical protein [Paenibacillus mesophilus]TMV48777.1 hypothetical protein FE783_17180 [Paenibacillus mesophilus]
MMEEAALFQEIYPVFIEEVDRIEAARGKLSEFQLMRAAARGKDIMGHLSWERRQTVNAIFETYIDIYRNYGREDADEWVVLTLGSSRKAIIERGYKHNWEYPGNSEPNVGSRIEELSRLLLEKEAELLWIHRELSLLQGMITPVKKTDEDT